MKVHELARRAHTPDHVVRYYTRIGLLKPLRNPDNRYRSFSEADLDRLRFIRSARALGCSLENIALLLQRLESGEASWEWLHEWLVAHRHDARQTLARLHSQVCQLDRLVAQATRVGPTECALPEVTRWLTDQIQAFQPADTGAVGAGHDPTDPASWRARRTGAMV